MRRVLLMEGLLLAVAAVGCGVSTPLGTEESTSAIRAAEVVGAKDVPRAALHLQLAKEELDRATKLSKEGEKARARSLLSRAEVDAELAVVLFNENAEKQEAMKAVERVRQLWRENPERTDP